MDLQTLAQIGEFLGGLSVLLTLIYLAIQIRSNTKAVRSAGAQQTHDSMVELYSQLAGDAQLNRAFRVGTQDLEALTEMPRIWLISQSDLPDAIHWHTSVCRGVSTGGAIP